MMHWNWQQWETAIVGGAWVAAAAGLIGRWALRHFAPPRMSRHRAALDQLARLWRDG